MSDEFDYTMYQYRAEELARHMLRRPNDGLFAVTQALASEEPVFEVNEDGAGIRATQDGDTLDEHLALVARHAAALHRAGRQAVSKYNEVRKMLSRPTELFTVTVRQDTCILLNAHARSHVVVEVKRTR